VRRNLPSPPNGSDNVTTVLASSPAVASSRSAAPTSASVDATDTACSTGCGAGAVAVVSAGSVAGSVGHGVVVGGGGAGTCGTMRRQRDCPIMPSVV